MDKKIKAKYNNTDNDEEIYTKAGRNRRRPVKQEYYFCEDCGKEFHRKERICSECGSRNISRAEE